MATQKHVLFYSNFCHYCKDVLSLITKKDIKGAFLLVCVDNIKYDIPQFVDRVPMVVTRSKDIVADDAIHPFIESLVSPKTVEIAPFALMGGKNNLSDSYGYIDDANCTEDFCRGFVYVHENPHIEAPEEVDQSNKMDSSTLERFMSERENDIITINTMPRQF
jgi:hypothetical protein